MAARELPGILDARWISCQQGVDKPAFSPESGQHGEIDVQRDARFAPSLHGQTAEKQERQPCPSQKTCNCLALSKRSIIGAALRTTPASRPVRTKA